MLEGKQIIIIGEQTLQNQLMASYFETETGASCVYSDCLDKIRLENNMDAEGEVHVLLFDCSGRGKDPCIPDIYGVAGNGAGRKYTALFNILPESGVEEKALRAGVRGVFYIEDSIEQIKKGICAILKGELWVPRKAMSKWILSNHKKNGPDSTDGKVLLTKREKEILSMVAQGYSNQQIADQLFISPYTVKTHIHNIFKKIDANSRMQAVLWAFKNL